MSYIPLYRKWRSQNFDEIVGQQFIVQTLKNAIKSGRISHAYLFSGPRGTGKTSTARIFAKSLNCVNGPTDKPCGVCDMCKKITNGHAVDVIEIDAASNRGIDEIRDLREKVRYVPVEGKFKVYIIDEVHMLTSEAFNALLKTLEEPPVHIIFVLATTEPQKVPVTISSRCQRLDFRRIPNQEIVEQLKKIASAEGIKIEDGASSLIARNSDGSMRDAISLLDQLISFSGKDIKHDDVISVLGTANADLILDFGDAMGRNDVPRLFDLINRLVSEGRSVPQSTKDILLHLRNILLVLLGNDSVVEESTEHINKLKVQSSLFTIDRLKTMISFISRAESDMKWHPQARLLLEIAVMDAASSGSAGAVEKVFQAPSKAVERPEKKSVKLSEFNNEIKQNIAADAKKPVDAGGISSIKSKWQDILAEVKNNNLYAFISLHEGEPSNYDGGRLTIKFKKGFAFHKERLEDALTKAAVEKALKKITGQDIRIDCVIDASVAAPPISASKVAELFGGEVVS
jgi:DNA polymerase-3 subunit gamma/tau